MATLDPASAPVLRRGDTGEWVVYLQQALLHLGRGPGVADGDFGPGTEAAVQALQHEAGLDPDGLVGRDTWSVLARGLGGAPAPAVSRRSGGGGGELAVALVTESHVRDGALGVDVRVGNRGGRVRHLHHVELALSREGRTGSVVLGLPGLLAPGDEVRVSDLVPLEAVEGSYELRATVVEQDEDTGEVRTGATEELHLHVDGAGAVSTGRAPQRRAEPEPARGAAVVVRVAAEPELDDDGGLTIRLTASSNADEAVTLVAFEWVVRSGPEELRAMVEVNERLDPGASSSLQDHVLLEAPPEGRYSLDVEASAVYEDAAGEQRSEPCRISVEIHDDATVSGTGAALPATGTATATTLHLAVHVSPFLHHDELLVGSATVTNSGAGAATDVQVDLWLSGAATLHRTEVAGHLGPGEELTVPFAEVVTVVEGEPSAIRVAAGCSAADAASGYAASECSVHPDGTVTRE